MTKLHVPFPRQFPHIKLDPRECDRHYLLQGAEATGKSHFNGFGSRELGCESSRSGLCIWGLEFFGELEGFSL